MPYKFASQVLGILNNGAYEKKRRDLEYRDFEFASLFGDDCIDPAINDLAATHNTLIPRSIPMTRGIGRRQSSTLTPGYVTTGKSL